MIASFKRKLKKILYILINKYPHLKKGINVPTKWYGNDYGGFYLNPEKLNENSIIYSFGIGEDISFDLEVIKAHNCKVFGFDPTPRSIDWIRSQQLPVNFHFIEKGIGTEDAVKEFFLPKKKSNVSGSFVLQNNVDEQEKIPLEMLSLNTIMQNLNHQEIAVLKMDIEGGEYDLIDSLITCKYPIRQLLIEFHDRFLPDGRKRTIEAIEKLKKNGFEIFGVSDTFEEVSFINIKS
jgi:FkbM family methyltransferase